MVTWTELLIHSGSHQFPSVLPVLCLAGKELISSMVPGMGLCFGFVPETVLVI